MCLPQVLTWFGRLNATATNRPRPSRHNRVRFHLEELEPRQVLSTFADHVYVATLYQGVLGRQVESSGLAYWSAQLDAGVTRQQVAAGVLGSDEFLGREVQLLYKTLLGRDADVPGLSFWLPVLQGGGTVEQIKAGIIASDEFFARAGGTPQGFLSALYRDELGRAVDSTGLAVWGSALASGSAKSDVALQVENSLEADQLKVGNLYREVLSRPVDSLGLNYWTGALQGGAHIETVLAGLLGSAEFAGQLNTALASVNTTDPNGAASLFLASANKFGASLPGLEQLNRNIGTLPVVFVSAPAQTVQDNQGTDFFPVFDPFFDPFAPSFVDVTPPVFVDVGIGPVDLGIFDPGFSDFGDCGCDFGGGDFGGDGGDF